MGTIINSIAVLVGASLGLVFKKFIKEDISKTLLKIMGVCIIITGVSGTLSNTLTVEATKLVSNGTLMIIISLVSGGCIGECLKIDDRINTIGAKIENKFKLGNFSTGFIEASLLYCIGAMTIVGCINDGILGDSSILILKACLDGIASVFLSASLGIGVLFSAFAVLIIQGILTISATLLAPYATPLMIECLCRVGYTIVLIIGLNMANCTKIKTANLIPALLVPIIWILLGIEVY